MCEVTLLYVWHVKFICVTEFVRIYTRLLQYIHMYIRIRAYIPATCIHIYTKTLAIYTHTHIYIYMCTLIHTCMHMQPSIFTYTHTKKKLATYIFIQYITVIQTYKHTHIHSHANSIVQTYIQPYIHHTYMLPANLHRVSTFFLSLQLPQPVAGTYMYTPTYIPTYLHAYTHISLLFSKVQGIHTYIYASHTCIHTEITHTGLPTIYTTQIPFFPFSASEASCRATARTLTHTYTSVLIYIIHTLHTIHTLHLCIHTCIHPCFSQQAAGPQRVHPQTQIYCYFPKYSYTKYTT